MLTKREAIELLKQGEYLHEWGSGRYATYEIKDFTIRSDTARKFIESQVVELDENKPSVVGPSGRYYKWVGEV